MFVFAAIASPLLGTEQCARGPPYWCQNVKTASLCGAVTHCQQSVWNKPQMKSVPCDLCKEVLTVVAQALKDNGTEAEILNYLEKACQLIPDAGLTAECKEMVDDYYPILINIIVGELEDPAVACGAMGLCRSEQLALAKLQTQKQLVSNEIPQVDLSQRVAPFLLNVPGLLYPQESPKKESPQQKDDAVCQDCVKLLTDAQAEAKDNSTYINILIEKIESQCDLLGPGMSDLCKQYISQYAPIIDPKEVCSFLGVCDAVQKSTPMLSLQPAKTANVVPAAKLFPAIKGVSASEETLKVSAHGRCPRNHNTVFPLQEEVIKAVEQVCTFLPSTLSTHRQFVAELDKTRFKAGGYCDVCKMAVNYIDGVLEQNITEAKIGEAVRKVCSFLPSSYQTQCDQFVEQYEPMLIQLLLQMMDPDFVCTKVGACPGAVKRLLGTEQCSWGPAFWCKNMETASLCNAVTHCKRHVWV
uniref:Prosaposin n=1 Tax=Gouania willdenowi TaxID=441366 RepID=A0A8C5HJM5_GOUWI